MTSGVIWTPYDWLNKFYSFCMGAIVGFVSRHGLTIEAHGRNQPNKSKVALYKPLLHFYSDLKKLYIRNKTEHFNIKVGVIYMGVCVSSCLKKELAWAIDKWLQLIY